MSESWNISVCYCSIIYTYCPPCPSQYPKQSIKFSFLLYLLPLYSYLLTIALLLSMQFSALRALDVALPYGEAGGNGK